MSEQRQTRILQRIAEQAVPDDLDLWTAVQARLAALEPATYPGQRSSGRAWRRRAIVGVATAAALAAVVGVSLGPWGRPAPVSAREILDRAQATADNASLAVRSYHLVMTRSVPAKENATLTTEIWYAGNDHQRVDQQTRDGQGNVLSTQQVIVNGDQAWIALTENGSTRVAHTTGTTWNPAVDAPPRQTSLAALLAQYSTNKSCLTATEQGTAEVDRRPVYVIDLYPRAGGCQPSGAKGEPAAVGSAAEPSSKVGQITVWVDEQSFLPLKMEVHDPTGRVLDRTEVTSVEYSVAIPDSTFSYTPPAGATVRDFNGGSAAEVKQALGGDPVSKAPPTRQR